MDYQTFLDSHLKHVSRILKNGYFCLGATVWNFKKFLKLGRNWKLNIFFYYLTFKMDCQRSVDSHWKYKSLIFKKIFIFGWGTRVWSLKKFLKSGKNWKFTIFLTIKRYGWTIKHSLNSHWKYLSGIFKKYFLQVVWGSKN